MGKEKQVYFQQQSLFATCQTQCSKVIQELILNFGTKMIAFAQNINNALRVIYKTIQLTKCLFFRQLWWKSIRSLCGNPTSEGKSQAFLSLTQFHADCSCSSLATVWIEISYAISSGLTKCSSITCHLGLASAWLMS